MEDPMKHFHTEMAGVCQLMEQILGQYGDGSLQFVIVIAPREHVGEPDALSIIGTPDLRDDAGMERLLAAAPKAWRKSHAESVQ